MTSGNKDKNSQHTSEKKLCLSDDFPKPSTAQWREMVDKQLKGASFDEIMLTTTIEGITLDPIYCDPPVGDLPGG